MRSWVSIGYSPTSVIVEILNEDGTMARRSDLEKFAAEHNLKMGTIADLIHYRVSNEKTIERISECGMPTEYGDFRLIAYQDCIDNENKKKPLTDEKLASILNDKGYPVARRTVAKYRESMKILPSSRRKKIS